MAFVLISMLATLAVCRADSQTCSYVLQHGLRARKCIEQGCRCFLFLFTKDGIDADTPADVSKSPGLLASCQIAASHSSAAVADLQHAGFAAVC